MNVTQIKDCKHSNSK